VDWRGVVAAVLAFGIVAVLILIVVTTALNPERTATADEISSAATVLGAAIGAIAVYLGGRNGTGKPGPPPPPAGPENGRPET
jgi:hypothetical protein